MNSDTVTGQGKLSDPEVSDLWRQAADAVHEWSLDALRRLDEARQQYNSRVACARAKGQRTGARHPEHTVQGL
jgi:hypothetical protein